MTEEKKSNNLADILVESGVHFGHRVANWNPKMSNFIFGKRNKIHIINIRETIKGIIRAQHLLKSFVADGKSNVLFVGTKRQSKETVRRIGEKLQMPYVSERWIGGTLTNFDVVRSRLSRLEELEELEKTGIIEDYPKKQQVKLRRELHKILRNLGGIRHMDKMPDVMIIVDSHIEKNAISEALQLDIPTIGIVDTDSDPDRLDMIIPANDDSFRSIEIILSLLADSVSEGLKELKSKMGAQAKLRDEVTPVKPQHRKDSGKKPRLQRRKPRTEGAKSDGDSIDAPKPASNKPLRIKKKKIFVGEKKADEKKEAELKKVEEPKKESTEKSE